jgi:hypothetical protein
MFNQRLTRSDPASPLQVREWLTPYLSMLLACASRLSPVCKPTGFRGRRRVANLPSFALALLIVGKRLTNETVSMVATAGAYRIRGAGLVTYRAAAGHPVERALLRVPPPALLRWL